MAGHSKWANIQHRKNKQDAKKGKIFTKLIRELTVAARNGGGDLKSNPRLRLAYDTALGNNMTKDTVERAIKRGVGSDEASALEEVRYEGYGPCGVALIIDCLTDNRNRTAGEVRHALNKHGGNLGTAGSVSYLFKLCGLLCFAPLLDENKIMQIALDSGAEDVITNEDGSIDVITSQDNFIVVKDSMLSAGFKPAAAETRLIASIEIALGKEDSDKVALLIEVLEDLDDVQNVYSNAELSQE